MPSERLQGIFVPNIVPLDARSQINESELRRYTSWLIDEGVHGLYPNGSTGEFTRFTAEERRRIIAIIADETRGRVPILAGAAEANVRETLSACEHYAGLGVRSVAIVSPIYFKLSPDSVFAYFKEIGDRTPIDVTLYNIPLFAPPIDVDTVARLAAECPRIVAIKDSSGDMAHMLRMIKRVRPLRPDFSFLTGWDAALLPMLLAGCDGGTNAVAGIAPRLTRRLFELARELKLDEARRVQEQIIDLFDAVIYSADFPEGIRAAVDVIGFRTGSGRQPLGQDQQARIAALREKLVPLFRAAGILK
jgi:4-hydroxy-tetrahydrodipicolinate synthase